MARNAARPGAQPAKKREYLTDDDVRLLVAMRNETPAPSMRWLARKFEVSLTCVADLLSGKRRSEVTGIKRKAKRYPW